MIDKQTVIISGSVGGSLAFATLLMNTLYNFFSDSLDSDEAFALAVMGLILFALVVLAIDTRIKLNQVRGDNK